MAGTIIGKDKGIQIINRVQKEHIRDELNKLDVFKSAGPDEIHPKILMNLGNFRAFGYYF